MKASGKKIAAAQKKAGKGLFAPKQLSADLAALCGRNRASRPDVTKAIWAYIKKNKLNKGRTIHPDGKLKKVLPANSLGYYSLSRNLFALRGSWNGESARRFAHSGSIFLAKTDRKAYRTYGIRRRTLTGILSTVQNTNSYNNI